MLILLIENNESEIKKTQKYAAEFFPSADIMPFSDAVRAMEFINSDKFSVDMCFTKIIMPEVSGFKIAKELKEKNPSAKIVFMEETPDYAGEAWKYGGSDYIVTPVTKEAVNHAKIACL